MYLLLAPFIPKNEEKFLIDEIEVMINKMNDRTFVQALKIMYSEVSGNPLELLLMMVVGLTKNKFFDYVNFIRGLHA